MEQPFVNIHTHVRRCEALEVVSVEADSALIPPGPVSVGVHPWRAECFDRERAMDRLENADMVALGEIGLDLAAGVDVETQMRLFEWQLTIAQKRSLPVVLHCVRAFEPVMKILSRYRLKGVVFHGYVGSSQQARRATDAGYCVSVGERSLKSVRTVAALRDVPHDRLFLETDESERRISEIYHEVERIVGCGLKNLVYDNYCRIFAR